MLLPHHMDDKQQVHRSGTEEAGTHSRDKLCPEKKEESDLF